MRLSFRRITTTTTQVRVQQRGGNGGTDTDTGTDTEARTRISTAREGGAITPQDIGTGTSTRTAREGATTPRGLHRKLSRGGKRALSIVVPSLDMMTGRENTATMKDEVGAADKVATVASAGTAKQEKETEKENEEEGKEEVEVEVNHLVDYVVVAGPPVGIAGDVIGRCNVRKLLMKALLKGKRQRGNHPASPPSSSSSSSSSSSPSSSSSTPYSNGSGHTGDGLDRRLCATVNLPGCNPTLLQRYPDTDRKSLALVRLFVVIIDLFN